MKNRISHYFSWLFHFRSGKHSRKNALDHIHISKLRYNNKLECFETELTVDDKYARLSITDIDITRYDEARKITVMVKDWLDQNFQQAKDFAAEKLLKTKNDNWLSDDETAFTREEFVATMELEAVHAYIDGGLELYFDDNDLFWGHTIVVSVNESFEFSDADIAG